MAPTKSFQAMNIWFAFMGKEIQIEKLCFWIPKSLQSKQVEHQVVISKPSSTPCRHQTFTTSLLYFKPSIKNLPSLVSSY
jgi:hypothetical protein